jgi:hypothetical protein
MTSNEVVLAVIKAFEKHGIDYMLVGSYSSNAFGISRSTNDADFVVELGDRSINPVFSDLTGVLQLDPQMRLESVTGTYRYVARHVDSGFKVEFFMLSNDAHDQARFARRRQEAFLDGHALLPTPEDVVIQKLRWFGRAKRAKDLDDIRNVLKVQAGKLDLAYMRNWCDQHGTRELLEQLYLESKRFE